MLKKPTLLITGCGGMLGEAVYSEFKDHYSVFATDIDLNEPWLEYLNVSDNDAVQKYGEKIKPDLIFHLAALTDMEYCENHPEEAYDTNKQGTENIVNLAKQLAIPLVYISTAGIFDGQKEEYAENDQPAPLSVYGKSKFLGELAARSYDKSIVIRAGWMIGGGPKKDKKFINKIIKQINSGVIELAVVDDKLGTPTYTYDLAKIMRFLLERRLYGIYHGTCDGGGSRRDVAQVILAGLGLKNKVAIKTVNSEYFKDSYFAPRPASEQLTNFKLKESGIATRDWRICLEEYLKKFDWLKNSE